MNQYDEANRFLMGTGGRSALFKNVGDRVSGFITTMAVREQTDLDGNIRTWDDGKPRMQLVVTLLTEQHDDDDDDGMRRLYVRGQMTKAVQDAVRKAGRRGLEEDGRLAVEYVGDAEPQKRGFSGAKQYRARYEPPQTAVPDDDESVPF